jgi:hypothetical protein
MASQAVIEVLGGPMDGLRLRLTGREVSIGRKVGNLFSPFIDKRISKNHAVIVMEGHEWCLRDVSEQNKIVLNNKIIQVKNQSYPLKDGDLFLIGSTVIEFYNDADYADDCLISGQCWSFPLEEFNFSDDMKELLNNIRDRAGSSSYYGINEIALALLNYLEDPATQDLARSLKYQAWNGRGDWIDRLRPESCYAIGDGEKFITPRTIKIFELARAKTKGGVIGFEELRAATVEEGRSAAAKCMRDCGLNPAPPPDGFPPRRKTSNEEAEFICEVEYLVKAVVKDAEDRHADRGSTLLPGFDSDFKQIYDSGDLKALSRYLNRLWRLLVLIFNAQSRAAQTVSRTTLERLQECAREDGHAIGRPSASRRPSGAEKQKMVLWLSEIIEDIKMEDIAGTALRDEIRKSVVEAQDEERNA